MDKKLKHLEFIQNAIDRMASNLFMLKGWTVTLVAALFALAAKESNDDYFMIAYLPALIFWLLDSYFLAVERRFRSLYDHVRALSEDEIDFEMNPKPYESLPGNSWLSAIWAPTIL